jgi:geranylgeranyl diphosphate synthase, type II
MSLQKVFSDVLAGYKASIDEQIRFYLERWPQSHSRCDGFSWGQNEVTDNASTDRLKKACAYALLNGGKRFRPALVQMISKALGQEGQADRAALAVEFFHTASLIADDLPCMDDDDARREKPSLHVAYDEATALLTSYALIAAGYGCIAENSRSLGTAGGKVCLLALENCAMNTGIQGATGGQFLDLFPPDELEGTLLEAMRKKTASLFEIAFVFGWLFGGGNVEQLQLVKQVAGHFGMAFQIADDLCDQAQDMVNGRFLNLASLLGRDTALTLLQNHLAGYHEGLLALGLATPEMKMLADLLEQTREASSVS